MPAGSPSLSVAAAAGIVPDRIIVERKVAVATKSDFTEQEWKAMEKGVTGAGFLVSISDRDFTDTFGEVGALAKYLAEEHEKSDSELIRELASAHGSGFGLTASPKEVEEGTLDSLRTATAALSSKAPEELDAYRQLVVGVAERVANAKSGVAESETAAIEKIKQAVGSG
jgi:hypothetical protein